MITIIYFTVSINTKGQEEDTVRSINIGTSALFSSFCP